MRVMIWVALVLLPQLSAAVHTRVVTSEQPLTTVFSVKLTGTTPEQASKALTCATAGSGSLQPMVALAGTWLNTGALKSLTKINWVSAAWLPQASVAV